MKLRPYQYQAVCSTIMALDGGADGGRRSLIVMPTGTGKTVVFGHIVADYVRRGSRCLVLAHREELLNQAASKIHRVCGAHCEAEIGGRWSSESTMFARAPVVVSTVQTQVAGRNGAGRMSRFDPSEFGLIVVDEAHHAPASTYRRILNYYTSRNPDCRIVGATATPDRHDETALGSVFDRVSYEYSMLQAIDDGWLVDIDQQFVVIDGLDYSQVRVTAGDLNGADLARVMEEERELQGIADSILNLYEGRTTLVFAASVNQAKRMVEIFNRRRDCARLLTGKTHYDDRAIMLDAYQRGEFPVLVNVGVATEGFDIPSVEIVAMARATLSRSLYTQMIGRGTRPVDGLVDQFNTPNDRRAAIGDSEKPKLLVLDYVGNSGRHRLISVADVLGGHVSDRVVAESKAITRAGGRMNVRESLARAEAIVAARERAEEEARQARIRSAVVGRAEYSSRPVNPFEMLGVAPPLSRSRDLGATEKQIECLQKFGVQTADLMTIREASVLISQLIGRRSRGLCTYKQMAVLRRHGYSTDVTKEEASEIIDGIMGRRTA